MRVAIDLIAFDHRRHEVSAKSLLRKLCEHLEQHPDAGSVLLMTSPVNHGFFQEFEGNRISRLVIQEPPALHGSFLDRVMASIRNRIHSFTAGDDILLKHGVTALFTFEPSADHAGRGIPVIAVAHDMAHGLHPYYYSPGDLSERTKRWACLTKRGAKFLCTTSFAQRHAIANMGVPESRTELVPFAGLIEEPGPGEQDRDVLRNYALGARRYFVYPADIVPEKNHRILLMAYSMFRKKYPQHDVALVLAGRREGQAFPLDDAIRTMGLEGDVTVVDDVSEPHLKSIMRSAFAILYPSLYEDAPFTLHDVMTSGRPLLASSAECIPDIVGGSAVYFDPRKPDEMVEAMRTAVDDPAPFRTSSEKDVSHGQRREVERMIGDCLNIIRREAHVPQDDSRKLR
jgi:glycosyltransferase involved in cell wall biosynthesis